MVEDGFARLFIDFDCFAGPGLLLLEAGQVGVGLVHQLLETLLGQLGRFAESTLLLRWQHVLEHHHHIPLVLGKAAALHDTQWASAHARILWHLKCIGTAFVSILTEVLLNEYTASVAVVYIDSVELSAVWTR